MTEPPSLPDLFKSENKQLEKLRVLEIALRKADHKEKAAIQESIEAVMADIQRLVGLIEDRKAHSKSSTHY